MAGALETSATIAIMSAFPDSLRALLQKLSNAKLSSKTRLILSGAALALVFKILVGSRSKGKKYVSNLDNVGQRSDSSSASLSSVEAEYDIIIVGGGTTGCALAARLSEDPNIRVLLLEAGGSGAALSESSTPAGFGAFCTMQLTSMACVLNHRQRPRGKRPSGLERRCWADVRSSINAQMAQYGAFGDFDEWATYIGDDSWAWKNIGRYFRKFEAYQPHPSYPEVDASARGSTGPVHTGFFNTITEPSRAFVDACIGVGIKRTHDFNGKNGTLGAARIMTYVDKNYKRVSAETAYLTPDVLKRKNLTVAIHATTTRILFDTKTTSGKPRAIGVEFGSKKGGPTWKAYAKKEVIVSAGAVHSPHILMLSGIGAAEQLKSRGITPILDLPGVGKRLVDHPVIDLYFKDKYNLSPKWLKPSSLTEVGKALSAVFQYRLGLGGPLAMNFGECAAFVRSDDPVLFPEAQYPEKLWDSTSAQDSPDLELFSTPFAYKEHGLIGFNIHTFALHVYLLRPTSHGAVLLKSSDPWMQPSVNPNYISTPEDLAKLVRGVKLCLRIARTEPLASHLDGTFKRSDLDHERHLATNAEIEALVRERCETVYHPASTCRMAPQAEGGVVDSKLRVYGVDGLRVADASIYPWIVSGHTAGACYALAEKLADEIKAEFNGV